MNVILSCTDCPFNNQDNVYCRTCSIPARYAAALARRVARRRRRATARRRRALQRLSDVYCVRFNYGWRVWSFKVSRAQL
jgi:hypothetical protein